MFFNEIPPATGSNFVSSVRQCFKSGHSDTIGPRPTMEDASAAIGDFAGCGTQYYAIFDGHGGNNVAHFAAYNLHRTFASLYQPGLDVEKILVESIQQIHEEACKKWPTVGCTAAIVIIINGVIYCANLGDTRIIFANDKSVQRLSYDHKATDQIECEQVIKRGGSIYMDRVGGLLALTRSIGDGHLGNAISCEPYLAHVKVKPGSTLIIACDGVWDVMTDEEASKIALANNNPATAARLIMEESIHRQTTDNVSVICIKL